ncbi:SCO1431 family membrane protein [Streptomyces sp. NPDC048603]
MTANTAALSRVLNRARTGGPGDGSKWLENICGWALVVVVAMFVTQVGWL